MKNQEITKNKSLIQELKTNKLDGIVKKISIRYVLIQKRNSLRKNTKTSWILKIWDLRKTKQSKKSKKVELLPI